jgi:hypothetical protein
VGDSHSTCNGSRSGAGVIADERPLETEPQGRAMTRIAIDIAPRRTAGAAPHRQAEPVTMGLPLPRGLCRDPHELHLVDGALAPQAVQVRVLDRWADGSIKWALLDFQADVHGGHSRYELLVAAPSRPSNVGPRVTIQALAADVIVDTAAARFVIRPGIHFPFAAATVGSDPVVDPDRTGLFVAGPSGDAWPATIDRVDIEESGDLRSVVRCEGRIAASGGQPTLHLTARLHFFAGSATVRIVLTLHNPERAGHPGGRWTLGANGSVFLRDVSLQVALRDVTAAPCVRCSPELGASYEPYDAPLELYQESSGGDAWQSAVHRNKDGVVPHTRRGYRLVAGASEREGRRATPVLSVSSGRRTVAVATPDFWQNFPKAVEASHDAVTWRFFPRQYPGLHEIQGGEQKTHSVFVAFDRDRVTPVALDWCRAPLLARADPSWYCATGAMPYLVPTAGDPNRQYTDLVSAATSDDDGFERKRERIDEYGWRHFGDTYADHEAVLEQAAAPLVSHYNNQYDAVAGFAIQFLRSGDVRWWALMDELATHVIDIDIYRTDRDKAAYNHGLFWHTYHYVDAGTSSHRSYPAHPKVGGGGPSAEHNYSTGLMLHHFLTGDPQSRETAIGLARWVIAMDDGRQSIFRWIDRGPTGLASSSGTPLYHGPGRGAANSIVTLMNGHHLTGDGQFLAKAEALIRRCIHPADDVDARELLDAERRWYYTVFLQALGKYLDYKAELGAIDGPYAYARASLLRYASWMVDREYPYLDRPEILEYPNETWAAQDMRKSDVFNFAARHSDGEAQRRFLERADYFFRASVSTLTAAATRALARPVTLMLTNGFMHAWFQRYGAMTAPAGPSGSQGFGVPSSFVPQKVRAVTRLKRIVIVAAAVAAGAAVYLLI